MNIKDEAIRLTKVLDAQIKINNALKDGLKEKPKPKPKKKEKDEPSYWEDAML